MMPDAVRSFQRSLSRRLSMSGDWAGHELATLPHISSLIGRPWRSATFDGQSFDVEVAATLSAGAAEAPDRLCGAIAERLCACDLAIAGYVLIEMSPRSRAWRKLSDGGTECQLRFEALMIAD